MKLCGCEGVTPKEFNLAGRWSDAVSVVDTNRNDALDVGDRYFVVRSDGSSRILDGNNDLVQQVCSRVVKEKEKLARKMEEEKAKAKAYRAADASEKIKMMDAFGVRLGLPKSGEVDGWVGVYDEEGHHLSDIKWNPDNNLQTALALADSLGVPMPPELRTKLVISELDRVLLAQHGCQIHEDLQIISCDKEADDRCRDWYREYDCRDLSRMPGKHDIGFISYANILKSGAQTMFGGEVTMSIPYGYVSNGIGFVACDKSGEQVKGIFRFFSGRISLD